MATHESGRTGRTATASLAPHTISELANHLAQAHTARTPVHSWELRELNQILEHTPEDMTMSVQAGLTLDALQTALAKNDQWLPIDPPHPGTTTVEQLLSLNLSGPRRLGYGTVREHLLGLAVVLADGRLMRNGGKVVKNVAGYDLCKLFVGHRGTLGIIVEATFKVQPRPRLEAFLGTSFDSLTSAAERIEQIVASPLSPVVLDLHNIPGPGTRPFQLVAGFAGMPEDVAWQLERARELGLTEPTTLAHETFWQDGEHHSLSVLPSGLTSAIELAAPVSFVARAGNGILHYRGGNAPPTRELPTKLLQRVKDLFDPHHILPALPW